MPRKPSVNYFESKGGYFANWQGQRHALAYGPDDAPTGPTYLAALQRFQEVMALAAAPVAKQENTVRVVLELYLGFLQGSQRAASTYELRRKYCLAFCQDGHGEVRCSALTPHLVSAWITSRRQPRAGQGKRRARPWSPTTVRIALTTLNAGFNWATREGLLDRNPLAGMERPASRSRGRETVLTPADHAVIVDKASRWLRQVAVVLENTGARPGEVVQASAAAWRADLGAFVYHAEANRLPGEVSHKSARRGKDRTIFLTGEALELVRSLVERYPTGPLFRTRFGRGWNAYTLVNAFRSLRKKCGLPSLTAYAYRHTFATRWLERGDNIDVLAALLGNSPAVIRSHYSHLCGDLAGLRRRLEDFKARVDA